MSDVYGEWYSDFKDFIDLFSDDKVFAALDSLVRSSRDSFAMNRKVMEKVIDVSWVEAIENGLVHLDNVLREPRKTIEDVEEVVPIALSRKITVESVKHLAQHTDLIQSIDKRSGKITPSKILNVYKEESLMTYENKFINTLVDRLYIFINARYEKLAQVAKDEKVMAMGYDADVDDGNGGKMKIELKIETTESLDSYDDSGFTIWQRVEKLKKAIEGYKGSVLCQTLGSTYIRPPVMRTNAIMKNVDLKACLTLWQYIESYDKVGYEINVENTAVKPEKSYVEDFYKIVVLNFLLFRSYNSNGGKLTELKKQTTKGVAPKFVKRFEKEVASDYGVVADSTAGYIVGGGETQFVKKLPADITLVYEQINEIIDIEREYIKRAEEERVRAEAEAERARLEEEEREKERQRIEEARQAELERIRLQREEEERQLQEMLAKKKAEQEAEEKERLRQEEERQKRLEEHRKREEAERLKREEEERIAAERARLEEDKKLVRSELGGAEGVEEKIEEQERLNEEHEKLKAYVEVTEEEIEEAKAAIGESSDGAAFEDPREVAARMKLEQQKREKERAEKERADRLKAERQYFESKSFKQIRREYSKNPIYAIPRLIRYILAMVFGIIPEGADRPDFKAKRALIEEKKRVKEQEKQERNAMEVYYKKYGQTFKYRFMRKIGDIKFKRKKRREAKGKPLPKYTPPVRTPEEQLAIDKQMRALYKEYRVSRAERIRRAIEQRKRKYTEQSEGQT